MFCALYKYECKTDARLHKDMNSFAYCNKPVSATHAGHVSLDGDLAVQTDALRLSAEALELLFVEGEELLAVHALELLLHPANQEPLTGGIWDLFHFTAPKIIALKHTIKTMEVLLGRNCCNTLAP